MTITPATAALDAAGISYRVLPYEHDPASSSYGLEAAEVLGLDPLAVFKTLVAELNTGEHVVAMVPVAGRLNLKALARAAGASRASIGDPAAAQRLTGYVVGGISPVGQRRALRTFVDEIVEAWSEVFISGGRRGLDLGLAPTDLIAITEASVVAIADG